MYKCEDVEITGLCNPDDINLDFQKNPYWTQISIPENLIIPGQKPDIEELDSVNIDVQIIRKKVVSTPRSGGIQAITPIDNYEGKKLTGRKLIIEGLLCQTVTYIAAVEEQSVNSAQFSVPFSAYIVIPDKIDGIDTKNINFAINSCVEDVFIKQVCKREIFKNVTLLLQAMPIPSEECLENDGNCINGSMKKDDCLFDCDSELINYKGICDKEKLEDLLKGGANPDREWTEFYIPEVLTIPEVKPEIEELMSVTTKVDIISQRVVKTPKFKDSSGFIENNEGTMLTGRKLIIEGVLRQKIIYTADRKVQSVHGAHFDIPFSVFIVVEEDTPLSRKYKIEPCIEDVFACLIGKKQIFKNVTLIIKATPIQSCN